MADRQSNVPTKHATKPFGHSKAATQYHGRTERQTKAEEMAIKFKKNSIGTKRMSLNILLMPSKIRIDKRD
jgi:hypothetical protein